MTTDHDHPVRYRGARLIRLLVGPVVAALLGVSFFASAAGGQPKRSQSVLADVPGLARDGVGMLRDDTIALWESFEREQQTQKCMKKAGHDYDTELRYPPAALLAVAADLGVVADEQAVNGETANMARLHDMSGEELNSYHLALYGETYDDVEQVRSTGYLPAGRSTFADGGCRGQADQVLPGVFEIRRIVAQTVEQARSVENRRAAWSCSATGLAWVNDPSDLEGIDAVSESFTRNELLECEREIAQRAVAVGLAADEIVRSVHGPEVEAHTFRYRGALNRISHDRAFVQYLRKELASARAAVIIPGDEDSEE